MMTDPDLLNAIVNRENRLAAQSGFEISKAKLFLLLETVHVTEIKLNLQALLDEDDEPFIREVTSIVHNFEPKTMKLRQGFVPKHIYRMEVA